MISWRTVYFLLCFSIAWAGDIRTTAQIPGMRKYTQLDGFTATNGYEFAQDERGMLWLGTDNGGMSFDGKKFKVLLEKGSFPDAEILKVSPLGHERVLLCPIVGNVCYIDRGILVTANRDKRLEKTDNFRHNNNKQDLVTKASWLSDASNPRTMYYFLGNDIKRYVLNTDSFSVSVIINNRFIGDWYNPVTHKHRTLVSDTNGVFQHLYDETGKKISAEKWVIPSGGNPGYLIFFSGNKKVESYRYHEGDTVLKCVKSIEFPTNPIPIPLAYLDHNQNLWLKYIGEENIWYCGNMSHKERQEPYHFLEPNLINTVFVDRNSNLWMSSKNNALYFLSRKHFRNLLLNERFPMKKSVPRYLSGNGKGGLCISYNNSNSLTAITGSTYRSIHLKKGFEEGCRNILPLEGNRFIIHGTEVLLYDMGQHTLTPILDKGNAKDFCLYGTEDLLVAGGEDLLYISSFLKKTKKKKTLFYGRVTSVGVLSNKAILLGTPNGLYIKPSLQSKEIKITDTLIERHNITDIQPLPGGDALIGTNARGLLRYTAAGKIMEVQKGKLNHVRSIYQQNDSVYWISTNEGVYAFTFKPDWSVSTVRNYTFYDGLPSNSATSIYVYQDTAYVATSEGLGILPLRDSTLLQMTPPDIYLNTLQAGWQTFIYPNTLPSLSRDQNNLSFSLSAISYESLGNIRYYYRLYPLQKEWVLTTDPDIRFAQVPPGHYTFQAYALNAKGVRSLKTLALAIYLQPAFWETSYFKVALVVLAIFAFYFLVRWWLLRREKRKYRKVQDKKRLAELELEAIKAQINPHFIYNCLNSIQYLNYKAEHQQAQEYLDLFARLIRMTMQYSQQTFISLEEETDYLSLYLQLEKLRFKDKLQYNIRVENNVNKSTMLPAMLIQPYVENAVKHGIAGSAGGEISICFSEEAGQMKVVILDNGPGFPNTIRQGALGLKLSGTRATSYNELFNLNIRINRYNRQNVDPGTSGAAVTIEMISINDISVEKASVG